MKRKTNPRIIYVTARDIDDWLRRQGRLAPDGSEKLVGRDGVAHLDRRGYYANARRAAQAHTE